MLSILIPCYNTDTLHLVETLYHQAKSLNVNFEILLADDASLERYRKINKQIEQWEGCRYLQKDENAGPACIRNYLAEQAKYPYLIYLDTDIFPVKDDFLKKYVECASPNTVVCGGFTYKGLPVPEDAVLRYKYGSKVEEQSFSERSKNPYHSFISMNFMIDKESFDKVKFDETFHLGYEDTHFGMRLKKAGVDILHIDNEVYHKVGENCECYLRKIERAVRNLVGNEEELQPYVKLLRWHRKVSDMKLQSFVALMFKQFHPLIVRQLKSKSPSLHLFAFYKLGYFCLISQKEKPAIPKPVKA